MTIPTNIESAAGRSAVTFLSNRDFAGCIRNIDFGGSPRRVLRARIAQFPGVFRKDIGFFEERSQRAVDQAACFAKLFDVVRAPERPVVKGQECLQALFGSLLAKEERVAPIAGNHKRTAGAEIIRGFAEPVVRFPGTGVIGTHKGVS